MPMNQIQFQPGMSLPSFFKQFGMESQSAIALERLRWPSGFRCPRCGHSECTLGHQGNQHLRQCRRYRHQASLVTRWHCFSIKQAAADDWVCGDLFECRNAL